MKARPTRITKLDKLDTFGNTTFAIEFDEGTKGFYTSKNADQSSFVVGNVTDFEIEVKQGKNGPYNKIKLPAVAWAGKPGGGGKAPQDPKQYFLTTGYAYSKDLVIAGKIDTDKLHNLAEDIFNNMVRLYNK
jgi:hypothetical protein